MDIDKNSNTEIPNYLDSIDLLLEKYDYFIFDCDGVIWKENRIITKCVEKIKELLNKTKKLYFLTNSNRLARKDIQAKLKTLCDLDIALESIYTASYVIAKYLQTHHKEIKNIYLIGEEGLEHELESHGLKVFGGRNNKNMDKSICNNFTQDRMHEVEIDPSIDACVCGFDQYINYFKIVYANFVINQTGLFFGTNYDRHVKVGDRLAPGSYAFISALETSTEKKATIVSKPDPRNLKLIMDDHNINSKDRILMIGDNLITDIQFANNCGIDSLLVLTGITNEEIISKKGSEGSNKPTYVMKHF